MTSPFASRAPSSERFSSARRTCVASGGSTHADRFEREHCGAEVLAQESGQLRDWHLVEVVLEVEALTDAGRSAAGAALPLVCLLPGDAQLLELLDKRIVRERECLHEARVDHEAHAVHCDARLAQVRRENHLPLSAWRLLEDLLQIVPRQLCVRPPGASCTVTCYLLQVISD